MSLRTDHSFLHDQNLESCISPKLGDETYDIVSEIKFTRIRIDFRYLSWKIQTANIKKQAVCKHRNFIFSMFAKESRKDVETFVKIAAKTWKEFNSSQRITEAHAIWTLKE